MREINIVTIDAAARLGKAFRIFSTKQIITYRLLLIDRTASNQDTEDSCQESHPDAVHQQLGTAIPTMDSSDIDGPEGTTQDDHFAQADSRVDILATAEFGDEPELGIGHFGPSSNHDFFRGLSSTFAQLPKHNYTNNSRFLPRWSNEHQQRWPQFATQQRIPKVASMINHPTEEIAMRYFQVFFDRLAFTMPFIDKLVIMQRYVHTKRTNGSPSSNVHQALFCMIWACGASSAGDRNAEAFYRRAMSLLNSVNIHESGEEVGKFSFVGSVFY